MGMLCPNISETFKMAKYITVLVNRSCEELLPAVQDALFVL
jgi:hypothetical protein